MTAPTPVERAAEALEPAMKGVWLLEDHEVAPSYARVVFESIDVKALARHLADSDGPRRFGATWNGLSNLERGSFVRVAEAVKAHLLGGAA